jgi:hypothetical protein
MPEESFVCNHNTPAVPTLAGGAFLDSAGVSHAPLRRIGDVLAGSGSGAFSIGGFGFGQHASDSQGRYYAVDTANNRLQQFDADGNHLATRTATQLVGSNVTLHLLDIDRTRNELHVGAGDVVVTGTHISVYDLSLGFSTLDTTNRSRTYGSSGSVGSGITTAARALTVFGENSVIVSSSGARKVVIRNHLTGALVAELDWSGGAYRFAYANSKLFGGGVGNTGTLPGLREIDLSLGSVARLDPTGVSYADNRWGAISLASSAFKIFDAIGYNNKIYIKETGTYRVIAWDAVTGLFSDVYWTPDSEPTSTMQVGGIGGSLSPTGLALLHGNKLGICVGADSSKSDYLFSWAASVDGTADQAYLTGVPLSTSTVTWTKTSWSTGTNVLRSISLSGEYSSENTRIRLRKNSEAWVTCLISQLQDATLLASVGNFSGDDVLTIEVSFSVWERLDGHATLKAVRNKRPPKNVALKFHYTDSAAVSFVPEPTGAFTGALTVDGGIIGGTIDS